MFATNEDFNVAASQAMAIASALETIEDKIYWAASTSLGQSLQFIMNEDDEIPEEFIYLKNMQNDLFCQAARGPVRLPVAYRFMIEKLAEKAFAPVAINRQREALEDLLSLIGDD